MRGFTFAISDFFRNLFNWRGRLSREGYWLAWFFVQIAGAALIRLSGIAASLFSQDIFVVSCVIANLIWGLVMHFSLLFAAMRRYRDSGKPGWLALIFDGLGRLCLKGSVIWLLFFFVLSGIGNIFPDDDRKVLYVFGGGFFVFAAGVILCIVNILFLIRKSDPECV